MTILDLFSGIGGFSLALQNVYDKPIKHLNSDINKYANQVYKYHFKNSINYGSVKNIQPKELPKIDIITFGSPCQDFSLAGKRRGLEGERSSLISEAIKLISECRPSFFIWENVKGTFSSNSGEDFAAILQAFANIGGYRLEWQLLNTKWFLPQNRERVYLVGYAPTRSPGEIFPITESIIKSKRVAGKREESACITTSYHKGVNWDNQLIAASRGRNPNDINDRKAGSPMQQRLEINKEGISNTLTSVYKDNYVVGTLRTHNDGKGFRKVVGADCPTIPARAREDGSGQPIIGNEQTIRRLTPIECERLQGFPDNWTLANGISDTQRYKMCGNAVTVDVVEAVGKRILKYYN